ncbi:hypothetical protein ACIQU3_07485 [Streptomyces sp. NPDC101110]|uniref:hypothetical protein n=1 Tax=Streptomyces sp. NPDC101110 TaxID=3366104 RepID=UPI00381B7E2A
MDAGLAAVLGALTGSVATIGAALATGWAQREGARITARSEHRRQRLEPRTAIYKEFVSHANTIQGIASRFIVDPEAIDLDAINEDVLRGVTSAAHGIEKAWADVALAGPESVATCAGEIYAHSIRMTIAVNEVARRNSGEIPLNPGRELATRVAVSDSAHRLWMKVDDFAPLARQALDDDGSLS